MASSLFQSSPVNQSGNNPGGIFNQVRTISSILRGDGEALFNNMYNSNPQFREFADSMKGKDPREAFRENGFDYDKAQNGEYDNMIFDNMFGRR